VIFLFGAHVSAEWDAKFSGAGRATLGPASEQR
jgi:hypothetical protein